MKRIPAVLVMGVAATWAELCSGWFICICPKCGDHANRGVPRLRLLTDCQTPFTVAEVVKPFEAQGARFVRGTDGAIVQAATTKDCSFVSTAKGVITADRSAAPAACRPEWGCPCHQEKGLSLDPMLGINRMKRGVDAGDVVFHCNV